jgi:acyl-coenzyme A synthetase/AMP-(fatty) acid ligase
VPEPGVVEEDLRPRIIRGCRERLAPFKVPRIVTFVSALDLTNSGKLARR